MISPKQRAGAKRTKSNHFGNPNSESDNYQYARSKKPAAPNASKMSDKFLTHFVRRLTSPFYIDFGLLAQNRLGAKTI
jgi:hypothetical protein